MQYIISVVFFLFIFFSFPLSSYAYDLEVQCDDTMCSLSSSDPIFPASTQWTPDKIVEKSIIIKSVGESTKDIFIKVKTEAPTGTLGNHMLITLKKIGSISSLWSGTLNHLLDVQTVFIKNFTKNEEFELIISAKMDTVTPNELQGGASVFDFGFGFDGDFSKKNNENNSNNNSSGTTSSSQNTVRNILDGVITAVFNGNSEVSAEKGGGDVGGVKSSQKKPSSQVMGTSDSCNNYFWVIALFTQALFAVLYFLKKLNLKISIEVNAVGFVASSIFIYLMSCFLWPILISAVIFVSPILFLQRKKL